MPGFTKKEKVPYIGITGFRNRGEVLSMMHVFDSKSGDALGRRLHIGVMMSRKTMRGEPTKFKPAFPTNEEVAGIWHSRRLMNCLHYVDYHREGNPIKDDLCQAIIWGGESLNALQLDMVWPDPLELARALLISRRQLEVILQIGRNAFEDCHDRPKALIARLERYDGIIDGVLLDKSMGQGIDMNAEALRPYVLAIKDRFPDLSITVAGGLGPETLDLVKPLFKEFPDLSIDAEGKMRRSGNNLDRVDWELAEQYVIKSLEMMGECGPD